jgi:hypothetical protein
MHYPAAASLQRVNPQPVLEDERFIVLGALV